MKCETGIAKLHAHYTDGSNRVHEDVTRALERLFGTMLKRFPYPRTSGGRIAGHPERIADRVARVVINSSRAAAAAAADAQAIAGLQTYVLKFVERGIPLEGQMLWSPKKHWMRGSESSVDLAELAAFQTLVSIESDVRSVYRPGMRFVIDIEDIEFLFMEGETEEIVSAQEIYMSGMTNVLKALGLAELFTLRRMSERAKNPEELGRWRDQIDENYRALEAYWYESDQRPVSSWETLPSLKEIHRLGWKGTIPLEMRRYYINRLTIDASHAKKVDMVLRNLAGILLHYQAGLLRGSGKIDPIKFSFVRSADGAPAELLHGRVDIRFAPRKLCSRVSAAAPWATKGFLCRRRDDVCLSFRGWRELAGAGFRFGEGWLAIVGSDGNARVRADFMRQIDAADVMQ